MILIQLASCSGHGREEQKARPPNILLIVSEDNGPDIGAYGVEELSTPNLDRLASEGMLFERAFVTYSVCSPSRGTIFTGLYPHQNGQIGLATHGYSMYNDVVNTLPVLLKKSGYRTGCLGKLHVNPETAVPFDFHPIKGSNFSKKNLPDYAKEAGRFIRASGKPFFLMVNFPDAHYPLQRQVEGMPAHPINGADLKEPLPFLGADSERLRTFTANYYNSMMRLDGSVGMLMDSLQASGKAAETLIVYLGDHGAQFSRAKCSNYEAGLRVSFIMRWDGKIARGRRSEELISTIDLMPTLLDAAGSEVPEELPGYSLLPLAKGEKDSLPREYIFAGGTGSAAFFYFPRRSVRDDRFKLIANLLQDRENPKFHYYATHFNQHFAGGTTIEEIADAPAFVQAAYKCWKSPPPYELYDLKEDPHEFYDLSGNPAYQPVVNRLKSALANWQMETRDPLRGKHTLNRFTTEVDSIMERYPDGGYSQDPGFAWNYHRYFRYTEHQTNE